jgi:hypothetical protein
VAISLAVGAVDPGAITDVFFEATHAVEGGNCTEAYASAKNCCGAWNLVRWNGIYVLHTLHLSTQFSRATWIIRERITIVVSFMNQLPLSSCSSSCYHHCRRHRSAR